MADDANAGAIVMTIDEYLKGTEDSVSDEVVELYWLLKRARNSLQLARGGTGVSWNERLTRGTVSGFAREKKLDVVRKNRVAQARLTNRGYGIGEMLHITDQWENRTPEAVDNLLSDILEGMSGDLFDTMGTGVYDDGTALGGLGFQGFDAALISSGTYANLSISTYPKWASNVSTGAASPYSEFSQDPIPALDAAINACIVSTDGGKTRGGPDVGFLPYNKFVVVTQTTLRGVRFPKDTKSLNFGWDDNFTYRGVTFYPSKYTPTDYMYLLNSKYIKLRMASPKFVNEFNFKEGVPLARYILMIVYGLLQVKQPRTCGRFQLDQ
ncbi:MAG: phage major capsid protein [Fidelibacterota bacterium]